MTHSVEIVFGLMIAVAPPPVAARKPGIAYPIPFVIGGLVPGMILQLRNEKFINDEVLRRMQRDLDLAELWLTRSER